ncbi:MAG: glutamate decarboxylase [Nocardioidaceae bacterium]|nr:glutamate decarboxylase [Nocardioidaceae bacterium]
MVAFKLGEKKAYDEFDIAWQLSAERGWMVPACTLPPKARDVALAALRSTSLECRVGEIDDHGAQLAARTHLALTPRARAAPQHRCELPLDQLEIACIDERGPHV